MLVDELSANCGIWRAGMFSKDVTCSAPGLTLFQGIILSGVMTCSTQFQSSPKTVTGGEFDWGGTSMKF